MAANFTISVNTSGRQVHLRLNGDFDGSSACELLNVLHSFDLPDTAEILIDTDFVSNIYPFGVDILQTRLMKLKSKTHRLTFSFTGKMASQFGFR